MHFLSLRAPLLKRQTTVSMPCLQLMIDGSQQMMSSTLICFPPHHSDLWRVSSFLHWNQFHYNMRSVKLACAAVLLEIYSK
ncbi:1-deoxy-D-xylulose 5-phosphate reductoisomerase [Trichinella pseudospiralis]